MGETDTAPHYWAFISYSHHDRHWAQWLHRRLETWRVPRRFASGRDGEPLPRRLLPVFRDRDELPSSADLGGVIQRALRDSRYLIVICSRHAAASRWVNEEIDTFKRRGLEHRVLCLKVDDGDATGISSCFPPALLQRYDADGAPTGEPAEPLAADVAAHADGREGALLKLIAGMLGVGYDELRRRERRRRFRQHLFAAIAALALCLTGLLGWHWQQLEKQRALDLQAQQQRLAALYGRGREALLAHAEEHAALLLGEAYRLGTQTPALRYMLGRAMRVVDAQALRVETGSSVRAVSLTADGSKLMAVSDDAHLRGYARDGGALLFDVALGADESLGAEYSPRGTRIWVDSDHLTAPLRRLRLYDAQDGALLQQYSTDPIPAESMTQPFDAQDRRLVMIDGTHRLRLIRADGGQASVAGAFRIARFCRDDRTVVVGRNDGVIELRDAVSLRPLRRFTGLQGVPTVLESTPDCTLVSAGTDSGAVRVWRVADGEPLMSSGHNLTVIDLRLNADGTRLMTTTRASINIWNSHTGALISSTRTRDWTNNLSVLHADGSGVARLSDGQLTVLDAQSGLERYSFDGHLGGPTAVSFDHFGTSLASGGADGSVIVWQLPRDFVSNFQDPNDNVALEVRPAPVVAVGAAGGRLYVGGASNAIWQLDPLQMQRTLVLPAADSAAFSADGRQLALSHGAGVRIVDVSSGQTRWQRAEVGGTVAQTLFDRSGSRLAILLDSGRTRLWDLQRDVPLADFAHDRSSAQAFAPDADRFAVGAGGVVRLLDLPGGALRWQSAQLGAPVNGEPRTSVVRFSPDGRRLLVTASRDRAYLLDAADGTVLQQVSEPASTLYALAEFSPDGRQVVIADLGKAAFLWRLADNRLFRLSGHESGVWSVSFSPDGKLLMTGGQDGVIKIWDPERVELLDSFVAHDGRIPQGYAGFAGDPRYLLSSGTDGFARLWDLRPESRAPEVIARLLRCRVPWRLDGLSRVPQPVDRGACP